MAKLVNEHMTNASQTITLNVTNKTFSEFVESDSKIKSGLYSVDIYVNYLLPGCIATFGTVTNIFNMIIFYKLGLKDSMSVGLMAISGTDFLTSFIGISGVIYTIMYKYFPERVVEPRAINYVSIGWLRDILFLCSAWITTILSIERCVCVVYPFKVKAIFTRKRCVVAIIIIYVVHVAVHLPVFLSHRLVWAKVETKTTLNSTVIKDRLVIQLAHNRAQIQFVIDILNGSVLPLPAQALVLISVVWMSCGLVASSRVRATKTDQSSKKSNLSPKEVRLVKVVWFLATILTICMVPRFMAVYAKQIIPEISFGNKYGRLYAFLWTLTVWAININAASNIFVYLIVNSSYRAKFNAMFRIKKEDDAKSNQNNSEQR